MPENTTTSTKTNTGPADSLSSADLRAFMETALTEACFGGGTGEPLETTVARYFHPDYVQTTDGENADYAGFVDHLRALRRRVVSGRFEVLDAVREGDRVADRHVVTAVKHDGGEIVSEVYLFGQLAADGRLLRVVEATRMLRGGEQDADLGRAR